MRSIIRLRTSTTNKESLNQVFADIHWLVDGSQESVRSETERLIHTVSEPHQQHVRDGLVCTVLHSPTMTYGIVTVDVGSNLSIRLQNSRTPNLKRATLDLIQSLEHFEQKSKKEMGNEKTEINIQREIEILEAGTYEVSFKGTILPKGRFASLRAAFDDRKTEVYIAVAFLFIGLIFLVFSFSRNGSSITTEEAFWAATLGRVATSMFLTTVIYLVNFSSHYFELRRQSRIAWQA